MSLHTSGVPHGGPASPRLGPTIHAGLPIPASVNGLPMPLAASLVPPMVRELRASLPPTAQLPVNPEAWWSRDA